MMMGGWSGSRGNFVVGVFFFLFSAQAGVDGVFLGARKMA